MPYPDPTKFQTPLARARNTGSSHTGSGHWLSVKLSALALVPLCLWFFFSLVHLVTSGADYYAVLAWVQKPYNSLLLVAFLGMNFYHALAGEEIIIDYVHKPCVQMPLLILYKFFCYGFGLLSVFTVLYITFRM
jgi:succinate dehydrogenase / fumarate reductase, membrane anchor subunit